MITNGETKLANCYESYISHADRGLNVNIAGPTVTNLIHKVMEQILNIIHIEEFFNGKTCDRMIIVRIHSPPGCYS